MEYLQRVWNANRERLHFRIPGSAPFIGLAYNTPIVETSLPELAGYFPDFSHWTSFGTFSILHEDMAAFEAQ